jgi:hypothetical protein
MRRCDLEPTNIMVTGTGPVKALEVEVGDGSQSGRRDRGNCDPPCSFV